MAKRKGRAVQPLPASASDPEGLWVWAERFLTSLSVRNYSKATVANRRSCLRFFVRWGDARSITRPEEVTKPILEAFQRTLFYHRQANGKPLGFQSQLGHLVAVRMYFKWLTRQNVILSNPASELQLPKKGISLPKEILSEREMEVVLSQPETSDAYGVRDRAILEVLYSTGIRRRELCELGLYDVDGDRGTVMVRAGKGNKDRVVPIGQRALAWVERYVNEARPSLVTLPDCGVLFLSRFGAGMSLASLGAKVRDYIDQAKVGKKGSCHLFRHTMATQMLERGADVRHIQEILGHADISSTQMYTHVSIKKLKEVHAATHPSAQLERVPTDVKKAEPRLTADDVLFQLSEEEAQEHTA